MWMASTFGWGRHFWAKIHWGYAWYGPPGHDARQHITSHNCPSRLATSETSGIRRSCMLILMVDTWGSRRTYSTGWCWYTSKCWILNSRTCESLWIHTSVMVWVPDHTTVMSALLLSLVSTKHFQLRKAYKRLMQAEPEWVDKFLQGKPRLPLKTDECVQH